MHLILKNNKGQALIETVFMACIFCSGLFFVLAVFQSQIISMAMDDAIETYFFCQLERKQFCKNDLEEHLRQIKLINFKTHEVISNQDYEITVEANTNYHYEITKKRRLRIDLDLAI